MTTQEPVNILLVDDQPAKLLGYQVILEDLGENLITAGSAREAFEHLLKKNIAVILVDVIMPELDGFELAAMIRNHPRFQRTAIIFVSAIAMTDIDRLKGYEHGAVDYVPVPVVPELLRAKVRIFVELYRKNRQLELLNAELERRVEERTAELAQANAELERRVEERTREREEAMAQVHEMQKMESLGQLTGGVAHDFNNVLMAVLGNLDLLARSVPQEAKVERLIEGAIRAAERGATLTARMLAFARRQELRPEAVDVVQLIGSMAEMLRRSLGPSVEIAMEFAEGLPPIQVDPNQLELAVLNLALNARDAMPQGGRVAIAARPERVEAESVGGLTPGDYVSIAVMDNGTGMDETTLKRAPEPFFTTKEVGKGTGLGLSMVYGLAAQSGGAARVSSRLGVGTTVELRLPIAAKDHVPRPVAAQSGDVGSTPALHILLVDDDDMVTSTTAAMLEQLGHHVLVASSGALALKAMQAESRIDLVITDHAMPGMTGIELVAQVRAISADVPIILATGFADAPRDEIPGVARLDKPYRLDRLASQIARLLEQQGRGAAADGSRAPEAGRGPLANAAAGARR